MQRIVDRYDSVRVRKACELKEELFRRHYGVDHKTYHAMIHVLEEREQGKRKQGRPAKLNLVEQVLFGLE